MALTKQQPSATTGNFETFYRQGMTSELIEARAEPDAAQIGLLPHYQEDDYRGDAFWSDKAYHAAVSIAEFYAITGQKLAKIGHYGIRLTEHEAPVSYVVLALEEPATYRGNVRTPGIVRCVIDVLEGEVSGRYFERHPFEKPEPILDEGAVAPPRRVNVSTFSGSDFSLLKRLGERAETALGHVAALQTAQK